MTNRLRKYLRTFSFCAGLLIPLAALNAQASFFNFNYNGPDSLAVGVNCTLSLQGNIPNPIVTSTIGATIITSMFDAATSGFPFNQQWIAGETAHIYWFVADNMGHSNTFEFFVFFVDNTPPAFNLTGINDTLFFNSIIQVPPPPSIPILDNCTGFTQTYVETARPDTCEAGQFTRTWTATDLAGNKTTFTQTVIIAADVTPPTITFPPQNGSAPCQLLATAYPAWLSAQMAAFTAQDPSGIKSLTNNGPATYPPGCKVPLTVTFKATDNCNLMIPTTAVFTTSDTQGPVIVAGPRDTVAYCSPGGNHLVKLNEWIHNHAYMQVTDACSEPLTYSMLVNNVAADSAAVVAAFWASFDNPCGTQMVGNHMVNQVSAFVRVTFIVRDACGNPTNAGQATFAAADTLPPVITGTGITEQCGGGNDQNALENWINAKGGAAISDDCSAAFWTNYSYSTSNGQTGTGAFNSGPYPAVVANNCMWYADVTFRASDECGNLSAKTLRFQIIDNQPPVFTGLSPNITVYCPNPLPTVPAATITDNCDLNTTVSFSRIYKDSICDGSYTVVTTWQATDDCNNSTTIVQNIFVRDTTRPVFTLVPVGLLMRCDTFVLPPVPVQGVNINATDICSPVVSITTSTTSAQNPNPALCNHYSYNITRTFTATDECGNTQTASQLISVLDNLPPVPGGVLDTTALCNALMPFPAPTPIAVDACSGPTTPPLYVDTETIPGACAGQYTLKLNWIANDVCGNQTPFEQLVHVIDSVAPTLSNLPPNITVECDAIPAAPNSATFNGTDNCSASVTVNLQEIEIRNPNLASCDHWTNYTLRRQWTAMDDCGNARTYTQDIQIEDTTPPNLVPPPAITLPTDMDDCGADIPIPAPLSVFDICTSGSNAVLLKDTLLITPLPNGSNGTIPVDTMVFHFFTPNLPPAQPATTNVSLSVFIDSADAEGGTEFFKVYGENGAWLGNTSPTPGQCSAIPGATILSITAAQFNDWASDGDLTVTLAPNGFAGGAINPTCPNSRVRMHVGYSYAIPLVPVALTYSLDGAPPANFPPAGTTFFGTGAHTVVYTATDCAGNSSTASVQVVVNDTQPPGITAPAPIITYVGPGNCQDTITLPFPAITENCTMSGHLNKSSLMMPLSFIVDPDAGIIPADVTMGIPGLIPNAIANGTLRIKFKGDNANQREFFNIFHNVTQVTKTDLGDASGQCLDTVVTSIAVTPAQINSWAATGTAVFRAEANTDAGPSFDFDFINPCAPLQPNQTDGTSRIQAMLTYDYAIVNFTITQGNTIVYTGALQGNQTSVILSPGTYTVKYTTTDNAGLMGMTTFPLIVRDTIDPVAKCKASLIINVNPSGVNNYVLQPSEINNGSTDNCSGNLSYSLSQTTFNCNQAGSNFIVIMTVSDTSGNTATCATVVSVQNALPMPSYNSVCEGDTLQLFANPPTPGAFSYMWTHVNFTSPLQNPVRLNAQTNFQGLYTVKITGATGCTASGSVTVNFANLIVPSINVSGGVNYCQGQNIVLGTIPPPGPGMISYLWYADSLPNPVLLGTTTLPFFTVNQPAPGVYHYYVKIKINDCLTPNSIVININVYARPPAMVDDNVVIICAGESLAFGTSVSGPGLTYQWSGPLGWTDSIQYPLVSSTATEAHSGIYTLTTVQHGCASIPSANIQVTVKYTPPKPLMLGDTATLCVGDTILLQASVGGIHAPQLFEWLNPVQGVTTTAVGSLSIPNLTTANCGNWQVRASYQNCFSDWSTPFYFCPQEYPVVTAMSNSPICQDSTLKLTATSSFGGLNWCWTLPNNNQIFLQNPVITPGLPGNYQVTGKTSHGCADTAFVLVQGSMAPVIDTIIVQAPTCEDGSPANLIPTISSTNGPFTYFWTYTSGSVILTIPTFTIPTVDHFDNGPYTLVAKDMFGCPSSPKTANLNVQAAVAMPALPLTPIQVCVGDSVKFTVTNPQSFNGNSVYHWINPQGDTTITTGPQLILLNAMVSQSGTYSVFVTEGVCQSPPSNTITLVVNPIPPAPVPASNQPVCLGDLLQLTANTIPGATYTWTGPGFNSNLQNPPRPNAILAYEGAYILHVAVNGCTSAPATLQVDIMQPPKTPIIGPEMPAPVCLEQFPIQGFLSVSSATQVFGAKYTWLNPASGDTIQGPGASFELHYADLPPDLLTPGLHTFQVVAWKQDNPNGDGCNSAISNTITVRFDTIPDNYAQVPMDHPACVSNKVPLVATHPSGNITGQWTQIGGPGVIITNRDSSTASFPGAALNDYTFTWSLSSGGCKNFSIDTLSIMVKPPEKAYAGVDTFICIGNNFLLNANQGQYSDGLWSQMGQIGVIIADSLEPVTPVTGLNPGNRYFFVWTLADIGCGAASDTVSVSYYSVKPNITGEQFVCTGANCTLLQTQAIQSWEFGSWTSKSGSLAFDAPHSPSTNVCNLVPDVNVAYWTINNGACGSNSRDTFEVNYEIFPVANPDFVSVNFGDTVHFDVLPNDILPTTPPEVTIIIPPANGSIIENPANGKYVYKPNSGFSGTDELVYKIRNIRCGPDAVSSTTVTFNVGAAGACFVPSIFTPNGDGLNDAFRLPPECFLTGEGEAKIEVTIFNQWGDYVYHEVDFRQDFSWDGKYNGEDLPAGTYYYVVKIEGAEKPLAGFLIIQR